MATQEISGLPFLCWVPDVQNFNGIVLRAVGDDMRQAPLPGAGCPTHSRFSNEWDREAEYVILNGHS